MVFMSSAAEKLIFAHAAQRIAASGGPRAKERRRFRRMPVVVAGRLLDGAGREHDCRTADISPGDVRLAASRLPDVDERVVIYLEGLGRMSGRVARRCGEGEVAIIFDMSTHKREKMAETITWAVNKDVLNLEDVERRAARYESAGARHATKIELESGVAIEGEVLDFSLAGMTVRTLKTPPPIGAWVRVGNVHGRIARYIEGGFAIDFEPSRGRRGPPPEA